ncbi:MFS transporter [Rhodococcus sp. 06-156-3C]|uniref:peptide MFS transporter n=1 Tax=Nocardiaceae TaxID=85025 RepID=UPI00069075D1|nr:MULTISPECIES: oligopeptide:H+ symporter [Rhodococcus]OZD18267.1 MFS transporter [Rhodococcus sp. 06-156-4C]OZD18865.1 MFS transporter [Rhodococcus sp. 06-156-3C]OZD22375.1 MFS transporter [Rhodococcus sp. 06-156-4a]OZD33959.1 MFS transporter [Rhodococcus sp. 06-156-3b]OZD38696.1 MFS transporter [Rhodococcus sp. 06-156-3]
MTRMFDSNGPDTGSPVDTTAAGSHRETQTLGQPTFFWNLTLVDLWERFSFYGLQGVLTFYLLYSMAEGGLEIDPLVAVGIAGAYGGLTQITSIGGSWLADRIIAPKKMVLIGAIVIAAGHVVLGVVNGVTGLAVGLFLIIVGTGALKTNLMSIVGMLYERSETRRDAGFTIFIASTNMGSVLGPLLMGITQSSWGFHAAFGLAAIGMILGLIQFSTVYAKLPPQSAIVRNPIEATKWHLVGVLCAAFVGFIAVLWFSGALTGENLATTLAVLSVVMVIFYFTVMLRSPRVTSVEKTRVWGLIPICAAGLVFFAYTYQVFTTVPLFVTESVDTSLGSWAIPDVWFVTVMAIGSIGISPVLSALWTRLGVRQPKPMTKMSIGFTLMGAAHAGLYLLAGTYSDGEIPALLVIICLLVAGFGEAFLLPIVLSVATRVVPLAFKTQGLAAVLLCLGVGSILAGVLGGIFTKTSETTYFGLLTVIAFVAACVLAVSAQRNFQRINA